MSAWFAIVDGAADQRLFPIIETSSRYACLYEKDYERDTLATLPFLVEIKEGEQLPALWRQHEAGRFWGIVLQSPLEFAALRRHLRKFTTARLPEGDIVLFRFWDPRVFRTFAENGTEEETGPFFSKINAVIADLGSEGRRRYTWANGIQIAQAAPVAATESTPQGAR